jgi:Xaa-Pro aminopeptidase
MQRTRRVANLRRKLSESKLDAFLVSGLESRYYLSGFTGDTGTLLVTADRTILFVDSRFREQAKQECPLWDVVQFERFHPDLARQWQELKARYIGFESHLVSYADFKEMERQSPRHLFVPVVGLVEELRAIKETSEIQAIRRAIKSAEVGLERTLQAGLVKKREEEIAYRLEQCMHHAQAQRAGFDTIVASGVRSALPHGIASNKQVTSGEIVLFDWGALRDHYISDLTRCFVLRKPTAKQRAVHRALLDAQLAGLEMIGPGGRGADIDQKVRTILAKGVFGDYVYGHGLGHGVGLQVHEEPRLSVRSDAVLQPGHIVTIEPGLYIPGWGGIRLEDMVLVTKTGHEVLTSFPKDLRII